MYVFKKKELKDIVHKSKTSNSYTYVFWHNSYDTEKSEDIINVNQ